MTAIALTLVATLFYGAGLVITQFALRYAPPWRGAAISVPTAALMFWCAAPALIDLAGAHARAALIFALVGLLFPATVTLLSMEANRRIGPNLTGVVGNTTPLFSVLLAVMVLGEALGLLQGLGIAIIVAGVMLLSLDRTRAGGRWPLWVLALPVVAALVRGAAPPAVKLGLASWNDPFAAVLIGYTVSAAVLIAAAHGRAHGRLPQVTATGVAWFAAVGVLNGLAVLLVYAALARGPVTLVAPLFAAHPLVTLALSRLLLRHEPFGPRLALGVAATVAGVALLIAGRAT